MSRNNRRHRREDITAEVYYQNKKNLSVGGCLVRNVSEGGVCVKIREFFPVGTMLELQFRMPLTHESLEVKGTIKWINKSPYNEEWEAGLEILENRHYRNLIKQYIFLKYRIENTERTD